MNVRISIALLLIFISLDLCAQPGPGKQTVDITSSFKPVLRNAVKINSSASPLAADTVRTVRPYNIPAQTMYYAYRAIPLKPLALDADSFPVLGGGNYVKAGFGNLTTPYVSAAIGTGDGLSHLFNVYGEYTSSKGKIVNQDFGRFELRGAGSYFTEKQEWYGSARLYQRDNFLYGYDHNLYSFKRNDVLQRFIRVHLTAGLRNKIITASEINYDVRVEADLFKLQGKASENSLKATAPFSVALGEHLTASVTAVADLTTYSTTGLSADTGFNNTIYSIAPALRYANGGLMLHAGITPVWDNGNWVTLPDLRAEFTPSATPSLTFLGGLTGRVIKNSLRRLTDINPWLSPRIPGLNTREFELYGGFRSGLGKHFDLEAKASFISIKNMPLFVNDAGDGKTFLLRNESEITNLRIAGELGYRGSNNLLFNAGAALNIYSGLKDNERAWGALPFELNASVQWRPINKLTLSGTAYLFGGSPYLLSDNTDGRGEGGADLGMGAEYAITPKISAWFELNNLLNSRYARWNNYEVYGTNVLGGVRFRF